jgi:transcriptional regulator with XRE-family HTH domain
MDPVADRILSYLKEKGISKSAFAEKAGINKASLSHLESGRNKASLGLVEAFHQIFPEVDLNWLILGKSGSPQAELVLESGVKAPRQEILPAPPIRSNQPVVNKLDNRDIEAQETNSELLNKKTLTVLFPDGTYLDYESRK